MALPTVRLNQGMTAWVGGQPFAAQAALPAGTTGYWAEWWYSPDADEVAAGAAGRQVLWMYVDVNEMWIKNIGKFNALREDKFNLGQFRTSP